jgi:hypothetical protein
MVLGLDDVEAELFLGVDALCETDRVGALRDDDRLAFQVAGGLDATGGLDQPPRLADERGDRKRDLFLPLLVVRGAAAFDFGTCT